MAIDVVAVLKIPHAVLASTFSASSPETPSGLRFADGTSRPARALGTDATLLFTGIAFSSEPEDTGIALRKMLGDALDRHDDGRGIYAFPSVAKPTSTTYDALIAEMGELGIWVPRVARDFVRTTPANAPGASLASSLQELQAAMPQDLLAQLQAAMASGDQEQLASLGASVDQILATQGDLIQRLQDSIAGAFGDPSGGSGLPPEAFTPEMLEQARIEMEAFARSNPELLDELQKQTASAPAGRAPDAGAKKT